MTKQRAARLDLRQRAGGRLLRMINPLARRMIAAGIPTGAPNVLLTVRGRRSGKPRTVPVGMIDFDGRMSSRRPTVRAGWCRTSGGR